ncbi:hypothetical protein [Carboxylicivirga sp. N1Y90]|uniref:hypothetical protein n=1 Tax=Carboxylicivirga fragile TaxID=3417571 RepID=UPI003D330D6E|nr:hypothetical protein [Marinilabiliaceae bacterium N1Y90]
MSQTKSTIKKQRNFFILRTIAMSILVFSLAGSWYFYHYVLVFNDTVSGIIYGDSVFNGGRYEVHTLKYYYEHEGITYFDKIDEVVLNQYKVGDSLIIDVLNFYPKKHRINQVHRDAKPRFKYDPEALFITQYHMHINQLEDYRGEESKLLTSPNGNEFHYSAQNTVPYDDEIASVLDRIRFNNGSLIETSTVRHTMDSVIVFQIYYYLNKFSLHAHPSLVLRKYLQEEFPDKKIKVSILDKSNAKHERIVRRP